MATNLEAMLGMAMTNAIWFIIFNKECIRALRFQLDDGFIGHGTSIIIWAAMVAPSVYFVFNFCTN
jgi:hypothetical protein